MKKVIAIIAVAISMVGCHSTTISQDTMMLQSKFPKATVYRVDEYRYIVADSAQINDVRLNHSGKIFSTVRIK